MPEKGCLEAGFTEDIHRSSQGFKIKNPQPVGNAGIICFSCLYNKC